MQMGTKMHSCQRKGSKYRERRLKRPEMEDEDVEKTLKRLQLLRNGSAGYGV